MSEAPGAAPTGASAESVDYLLQLARFGIKLGLDPIRQLLGALDNPHHAYPSILAAGTNGKGSVAALVERGLRAAGYRTGRYTSPHLVDLTERFALDGRAVDPAAFAAEVATIRDAADRLVRRGSLPHPPTFFEACTAVALSLFRRRAVDVAVLEVGMGGRFDATNVVTPVAVALPSIDRDHERYLGTTLAQIAFEKAGVIKPGSLVVTAEAKPEPLAVLRAAAAARDARLIRADLDVDLRWHHEHGETVIDELRTPRGRYGPVKFSLRGRHQLGNAAVAVRLLEELPGLAVPPGAIVQALAATRWPGRLDLVTVAPNRAVLLDAAHNVAAATALADHLVSSHPAGLPFVFSALADKDVTGILRALGPAVSALVCTAVDTPRALRLDDLTRLARAARPGLPVDAVAAPRDALAAAWRAHPLVVAAGSVYLIGELLASFSERG